MATLTRSVADIMQEVVCRQPSRTRSDDQIVEIFLSAHKGGRYSHHQNWLSQSSANVEVIAHRQHWALDRHRAY